jgi:hypothetical protein
MMGGLMGDCEDAVIQAFGDNPALGFMSNGLLALAKALDIRLDVIQGSIPSLFLPDPGPFSINTETVFHKLDKEKQYEDRISALAGALRSYYQQDHDENHTGAFTTCERADCIKARALLGD